MKAAPKIILLFKDDGGGGGGSFAAAVSDALQPNPTSTLRRLEDSFELSLDKYGIKDKKASGSVSHFVHDNGDYEVSVFLLENYTPPILACALNEVLAAICSESPSNTPTLVVPFLVEAAKLKLENKNSITSGEASLYGLQFGPINSSAQALASKIQKPPQLQIYHEQLACFLHLGRVLDIPLFVLVGQYGQLNSRNSPKGHQVISDIGEHLASFSSLSFVKERIEWNPPKSSRISEEPWRALYG